MNKRMTLAAALMAAVTGSAAYAVPANDLICNATDISSQTTGTEVLYATADANTATADADTTCNSTLAPATNQQYGVWWKINLAARTNVRIREASTNDVVVAVFGGASCGAATQITLPANACSDPSDVIFTAEAATDYWVVVGTFSNTAAPNATGYNTGFTFFPIPTNDTCAGADVITTPYTYTADQRSFTTDVDTTCNSGTVGTAAGAWFTFTSPATPGVFKINETSSIDAVMQAYSACGGALVGTCQDSTETITINTTANTQYWILIGRWSAPTSPAFFQQSTFSNPSTASYTVTATFSVPPANDLVCNATDLNAQTFPFVDPVDARAATFDVDSSCNSSTTSSWNGVWYKYLSGPSGGTLTVNETSTEDIVMSLWTGTLACPAGTGLTQVTGTCIDTPENNAYALAANTQYYILVSKWTSAAPTVSYSIAFDLLLPPANDTCATAQSISSLPAGPYTIDARAATSENDTSCNTHTAALRSVWFSYTPAANQTIVCNETSTADVAWTVFTSCGGAEFGCSTNDQATFALIGDGMTTYYFELAMQAATEPTVAYVASFGTPPANDSVCSATVISTFPGSDTVDVAYLTNEAMNMGCDSGSITTGARFGVWYTYTTGPVAEAFTFSETAGNDVALDLFTGGPLVCPAGTGLTDTALCTDSPETITWTLAPNTQYWILCAYWFSTGNPTGTYAFTWDHVVLTPPSNDTCATAETMTTPATYSVDIRGALDDADNTCNAAANTSFRKAIWYSYTPADAGTLFFNETSSNDVDFTIYTTATDCTALTEVYCNTAEPGSFAVTGGTLYYIAVGLDSATTVPTLNLALTFDFVLPPDNDDCESAEALSISGGSVAPDARVAGPDPDVTCNAAAATSALAGVWYSFSSPVDNGVLRLSETTTNDVVLVVYSSTAGCGTLTQVTCSDTETNIDTPVTAGTTYFVMVAMYSATAQPSIAYGLTYSFIANTGACCQSGGVCTAISHTDCNAISGGDYQGDNVSCFGTFIGGTEYSSANTFPISITDNTPAGVTATVTIAGSGVTLDSDGIAVKVGLTHSWIGDLIATITNGTSTATLFFRPGAPTTFDLSNLGGDYVFYDGAPSLYAAAIALGDVVIPPGPYAAFGDSNGTVVSLGSTFTGQPLDGTWTLNVSDNFSSDTGTINSFSVREATFSAGPCPTGPTPCQVADFDDNNAVSVNDLFAFLSAWFAQNGQSGMGLSADVDGNNAVSVNDLFTFLALWFQFNGTSC